jgi:hypothetical protein
VQAHLGFGHEFIEIAVPSDRFEAQSRELWLGIDHEERQASRVQRKTCRRESRIGGLGICFRDSAELLVGRLGFVGRTL